MDAKYFHDKGHDSPISSLSALLCSYIYVNKELRSIAKIVLQAFFG